MTSAPGLVDLTAASDGRRVAEENAETEGADGTHIAVASAAHRGCGAISEAPRAAAGPPPHSTALPGAAIARQPLGDSSNTYAGGSALPATVAGTRGGGVAPKPGKRKRVTASTSSDPSGERCSICLDPWTSKGKHRICALRCGHLFGRSCIERWLQERRSCPQCGAKVGAKGSNRVIPLFTNNLIAHDTGELETVLERLETEKRLRRQCEAEKVRLSIANESLKDQLSRLRRVNNGIDKHIRPTADDDSRLTPGARLGMTTPRTPKRCPASLQRMETGPVEAPLIHSGGASTAARSPRLASKFAATGSEARLGGPSFGASAGRGPRVVGDSQQEHTSPREDTDDSCADRFERVFTRPLRGGRIATFAGGHTRALLASQDFGTRAGGCPTAHGLTKISLADSRHQKNIYLHREQIRDVKCSMALGGAGYVLSTSFDKTLKVCDLRTDNVVVEYGTEGSGWSCEWSATNPHQMFCGAVDASRTAAVLLFDLRSTAGAVRKLRAAGKQQQPVHCVCHTANDELLCATMGGVWVWRGGTQVGAADDNLAADGCADSPAEKLPIQAGPCCSLSQRQDPATHSATSALGARFLVSTRGSSASHIVFDLKRREASTADGLRITSDGRAAAEARGGAPLGSAFAMTENEETELRFPRRAGPGGAERSAHGPCWASRWKRTFAKAAQGHQSQHALSRSLLWSRGRDGRLLIVGGDECTQRPWVWDAATGDVCCRLPPHGSPVLDVATLESTSVGGCGLLAAASQGELSLHQTVE